MIATYFHAGQFFVWLWGADDAASGWLKATAVVVLTLRGRSQLRGMFFGKLSAMTVILIGVSGGIIGVVLDVFVRLIAVHHFTPPDVSFNPSNFSLDTNLWGPVEEEVEFQGAIQTWLQRLGPVGAVFVTTLIFSLAHVLREDTLIRSYYLGVYHEEVYFVQIFAVLVVLAIIRQKTKSLGAACVAHITNNAIAAVLQ
jgi:membrane protease YdiL (CAAX protease family)